MKIDVSEAIRIAQKHRFTYAAVLDVSTIELKQEVREMCGNNTCGMYGKNWSCPPACGTLENLQKQIRSYESGILVQTVGEIEDSFDFETMMEIEKEHKKHFFKAFEELQQHDAQILALGAGCCTVCKECAYPTEDCRFPQKKISSMEAYGILVNELCKRNHMEYYYGAQKMAYTSCYLF